MKIFISILTLSFSVAVFASTSVVINGKKVDCQKIGATELKCKLDDSDVLVKNTGYGFTGVVIGKESFPKVVWPSEVIQDDKVLYAKESGFSLMSNSTEAVEADSISSRYMQAKSIVDTWKTSDAPEAKALVGQLNEFITKNTRERNNLIFIDQKNQKHDCNRGLPKSKGEPCDLFVCADKSGDKSIALIPPLGSYNFLLSFSPNKDHPSFESNGIRVMDPKNHDDLPLFENPKENPPKSQSRSNVQKIYEGVIPMPKSFRGDDQSFRFFTDEMSMTSIDLEATKCVASEEMQKLLNDKKSIAEKIREDISKIELSHYLTILNGQIVSMVLDTENSKSLGCRYNGMILSESMLEHLEFLKKTAPKPVSKYLSIDEVQDLYKKAKLMTDIPFGYKYDGCYARAHVMARRFEKLGIPIEKAWIKGDLSVPGTDIQWNYHVAPVINVKDQNGNIVKYVIDPSLNDKAVPLDTWVNSMSREGKGEVVKTSYPFPSNISAYQRTAVAISSSDVYVPDNDENRTESENMKLAIETLREFKKALVESKPL